MLEPLREPLAYLSHAIWSHWMRWMFSVGTFNEDGSWTMPADKAQRWQRQMNTPYTELPEHEREGDREQADKILAVINPNETVYTPQFLAEHMEMIDQLADGSYPHDLRAK